MKLRGMSFAATEAGRNKSRLPEVRSEVAVLGVTRTIDSPGE